MSGANLVSGERVRDAGMGCCCAMLLLSLVASPVHATDVRIRFKGPRLVPVVIEKAELHLAGWGWAETMPLAIEEGNSVRVSFDSPRARAERVDGYENVESVQLYIQARHLAPVMSEPFEWVGSRLGGASTTVDFRNGQSVVVAAGDSKTLTVRLRYPRSRALRFLDEAGLPVRDLEVEVSRFLGNSNHCGFPAGEPLRSGKTDDTGTFAVPDGDFRYAVELPGWGQGFDFVSPPQESSIRPMVYSTMLLTAPETVIRLRRFKPIRLSLRLFVGDKPAGGVVVSDGTNCGVCGACWGGLGETDAEGRLVVEDFYPDESDGICIADDQAQMLWGRASKELTDEPIEVRLPADAKPGTEAIPCFFP